MKGTFDWVTEGGDWGIIVKLMADLPMTNPHSCPHVLASFNKHVPQVPSTNMKPLFLLLLF